MDMYDFSPKSIKQCDVCKGFHRLPSYCLYPIVCPECRQMLKTTRLVIQFHSPPLKGIKNITNFSWKDMVIPIWSGSPR